MQDRIPSAVSRCRSVLSAAAVALSFIRMTAPVHAALVISSDATQNVVCSGGVCAPTSSDAVLNIGDLENLLASGNIEITTTGSGVQANDVQVAAPFSWSAASALTLDAYSSIVVTSAVMDAGTGGVSLVTNDGGNGGSLIFLGGGTLSFAILEDALIINSKKYKLAKNIKGLAYDIVANPSKAFALANDFDASHDGLYRKNPIPGRFGGAFNGLGHVISKLEVSNPNSYEGAGFFSAVAKRGTVNSIGFTKEVIRSTSSLAGGLAGYSLGTISNSFANATVSGAEAGGLVGENSGTISYCHSAASVHGIFAGGLVGQNDGSVATSFATGKVVGENAGGLIGINSGSQITDLGLATNSYATAEVDNRKQSAVGGLVGYNPQYSDISTSYSSGLVNGSRKSSVGGFAGSSIGSTEDSYWDIDTSGITNPAHGCGNVDNCPGVTGLTTAQFQAGLPAGFDPAIWAENPGINGGLPYLLANPPPP